MKRNKRSVAKNIRTVVIYFVGIISIVWLGYAVYVAFPHVMACTDGWRTVNGVGPFEQHDIQQYNSCRTLNEFGDYLAGSFAPLAFLWLMIAVFIQSQELREQRDALEAQLEENRLQSRLLREENKLNMATTNKARFEALLEIIRQPAQLVCRASRAARELDDVKFMQQFSLTVARTIETAVQDTEKGNERENTGQVLRLAEEISVHEPEYNALSKQLKDHDLQVFNSCKLKELFDAISVYLNHKDSVAQPSSPASPK